MTQAKVDHKQLVRSNHARFRELLAEATRLTRAGDTEAGLLKAQEAAFWAWRNSCGLFASPELEALLARLSAQLTLPALPAKPESGLRRVLTVMTLAGSVGGHSRMAWRWMALDTQSRHTLVLTQQGDAPIPSQIVELQDRGLLQVIVLDQPTLGARALALREQVLQHDYAVLLIHPHDVLANAALAALPEPPPVLFQDHAAHTFWLGCSVSRVVLSQSGALLASRRGVPRAHIGWTPIPIEVDRVSQPPARNARQVLGIPPDVPLLLSCGSAYKYWPIDGQSLPALLAPVLEAEPELHVLVVGTPITPVWAALVERFGSRVRLPGYFEEEMLVACYHACDIYLDSMPFTSPTAMFEAAACGRPILRFAPSDWRECEFSLDIETLPAALYIWSDESTWREDIRRLLHDEDYYEWRSRFGQDAVRLIHSDATFVQAVEAAYRRAAGLPLIAQAKTVGDYHYDRLDTLLQHLADNMRAQEAFDAEAKAKGAALQTVQPTSLSPAQRLQDWLDRRVPNASQARLIDSHLETRAKPVVLVVILDLQQRSARVKASIESLTRQLYGDIEILLVTPGNPAQKPSQGRFHFASVDPAAWVEGLNPVLVTLHWDWLLLLDAGDELTAAGLLLTMLQALEAPPGCAFLYGDAFIRLGESEVVPWFRPGLNLDLLLSYPRYLDRNLLVRRDAFLALEGFSTARAPCAQYDLLLRGLLRLGLSAVGHVEEVLVVAGAAEDTPDCHAAWQAAIADHLQARDYPAARILPGLVDGAFHIDYGHPALPWVSVIIPTRDQLPMLRRCVESLLEKTTWPHFEVLVVDNNSTEVATLDYLTGLEQLGEDRIRVLRYPQPFNFAAMNNMAVEQARGEYVLMLNNDTAVAQPDWLHQLMNHAQRPEVGAVGAKLLFPNTLVQHAGVVLGLRGPADHPGIGRPCDAPGYMHRLLLDQNYSAVTAACMLVRKVVYQSVGGMDEQDFKVSYNDVDLCLKIGAAGYLLVYTPHAVLLHEGSVSQTRLDKTAAEAKAQRFENEKRALYRKWARQISHDPAYNRNLSLTGNGFEVANPSAINWQPLSWRPLPVVLCHPGDAQGCGNYRVLQPYAALESAGLISGGISWELFLPADLGRLDPDVVVFQRQTTPEQYQFVDRIKACNRAFRVFELDDYLPNVPLKSLHRSHIPKDILKAMRRVIALMDRFVVSTPRLGEALADLHPDIRVVRNCLPTPWWGDLTALRQQGKKPRVGWAGGISHTGDLELIADIVKAMTDRVEWVFFGMCPDKLKPYVHEFHTGVPIERYPAKLASLNLDLALAPLEHNIFNECKSNLRLLEYGVCGYPVICTDIVPYQGDLPVTRVRNRYKDWMDAIALHLSDPVFSQAQGDALRNAVQADWMLAGDNLQRWKAAWLPD